MAYYNYANDDVTSIWRIFVKTNDQTMSGPQPGNAVTQTETLTLKRSMRVKGFHPRYGVWKGNLASGKAVSRRVVVFAKSAFEQLAINAVSTTSYDGESVAFTLHRKYNEYGN